MVLRYHQPDNSITPEGAPGRQRRSSRCARADAPVPTRMDNDQFEGGRSVSSEPSSDLLLPNTELTRVKFLTMSLSEIGRNFREQFLSWIRVCWPWSVVTSPIFPSVCPFLQSDFYVSQAVVGLRVVSAFSAREMRKGNPQSLEINALKPEQWRVLGPANGAARINSSWTRPIVETDGGLRQPRRLSLQVQQNASLHRRSIGVNLLRLKVPHTWKGFQRKISNRLFVPWILNSLVSQRSQILFVARTCRSRNSWLLLITVESSSARLARKSSNRSLFPRFRSEFQN